MECKLIVIVFNGLTNTHLNNTIMTKFKKRITLALLCLLTLASNAQSKFATLSGEIKNYNNQPLLIDSKFSARSVDTIKVKDGKFSTTISIDNPSIKTIGVGNVFIKIFLMPGKSLAVNFDLSKDAADFKYGGDLAVENVILDSVEQLILKRTDVFSLPAQKASLFIDSTSTEYKKYIDRLVSTKKVDPSFATCIKSILDYQCADEKMVCGYKHQVTDSAYYSFTKGMTIENEKLLDCTVYKEFLDYYLGYSTNNAVNKLDSAKRQSKDVFSDEYLMLIEQFKNVKVKEYCMFLRIYYDLEYFGVKDNEKMYEYFKKHNTDSAYTQQIRKLYAKKMLLASGKFAPPFTCKDVTGKDVSLSDFKGKIVYLDFWATGCGPCRREYPYLVKLQSEYKDKDVVFVSISIDNDCQEWKKYVIEKKIEGITLFKGMGYESELARAYQLVGVPTFILIDKQGRIVDSAPPRPSSSEIRKVINDLLDAK
jgi:thiol-disulfide isomerase/thioredoxin